jgi:hypothetical protein
MLTQASKFDTSCRKDLMDGGELQSDSVIRFWHDRACFPAQGASRSPSPGRRPGISRSKHASRPKGPAVRVENQNRPTRPWDRSAGPLGLGGTLNEIPGPSAQAGRTAGPLGRKDSRPCFALGTLVLYGAVWASRENGKFGAIAVPGLTPRGYRHGPGQGDRQQEKHLCVFRSMSHGLERSGGDDRFAGGAAGNVSCRRLAPYRSRGKSSRRIPYATAAPTQALLTTKGSEGTRVFASVSARRSVPTTLPALPWPPPPAPRS